MAAIKLAVALVHRIATGAWPRFGDTPWYIMVAAIAISTPVQAGEEIGWRGYALPRLAARFGFARGSILLGLIWACWHLPLFFIPGTDTSAASHADARRGEQFQGHCPIGNAGRNERAWAEHFSCGMAHGDSDVGLRRVLPGSDA